MMEITPKQKFLFACFCIAALIIVLFALIYKGLNKNEPIRIGLAATLSTTSSSYGIHVRNGVLLAAEQVNQAGGINGHPIELVIRDDKGDSNEALKVIRELIDEKVIAILGHYLSSLAVKTVPLVNAENILMISPTVSTAELSGLDDNFIRVMVPVLKQASLLADVFFNRLKIKKVFIVSDSSNSQYTESYAHHFTQRLEKLSGDISSMVKFHSQKPHLISDIVEQIINTDAEGLLILANAMHSATICQHIRNKGSDIQIAAPGWAFTDPDFIRNGGSAVEGCIAVTAFDRESSNERIMIYKGEYEKRFGENISMADQMGYDAAQMLFKALTITHDPQKLKKTILKQKIFKGLDGDIILDKYGDPIRTLYLLEIQNKTIKTTDRITLQELVELEHENIP
ncbi:ABC transporter substrate-binding protein [Desulfobacterales bacterium HSG17]|nr:ABC transporter substrate-binding protein [Desulfobacterales bacterium HSG17]